MPPSAQPLLVHTPSSSSSGGVVLAAETPSDTSDSPDGGAVEEFRRWRQIASKSPKVFVTETPTRRRHSLAANVSPCPPPARQSSGDATPQRVGKENCAEPTHPATPFDRPTTVVAPATTPSRAEDRIHPSPSVLPPPTLRLLDCTSARPLDRAPSIGAHGLSFLRKAAPALRRAASAATNEPAAVAAAPLSPPPPQIRTPSSLAALLLASSARRRRQQQAEADAQAPESPMTPELEIDVRGARPRAAALASSADIVPQPRLSDGASSDNGDDDDAAAAAAFADAETQLEGPPDAAPSPASDGDPEETQPPATPLAATQSPPTLDDDSEGTPLAPTQLAPATPAAATLAATQPPPSASPDSGSGGSSGDADGGAAPRARPRAAGDRLR